MEQLTNALTKKGHNIEGAQRIIKEAASSSNPAYFLNYWGISEKAAERYAEQLMSVTA